MFEPKYFEEAAKDKHWIAAMEERLEQIQKSNTWELVSRPKDKNVIGTTWVYCNKVNEECKVVLNKTCLVCKGRAQVEGADYDETFAPKASLEAITIFLAFASLRCFKFYQMDAKSTFLNDDLNEEVYVEQPERFNMTNNFDYVGKLKKTVYGLKQVPRA